MIEEPASGRTLLRDPLLLWGIGLLLAVPLLLPFDATLVRWLNPDREGPWDAVLWFVDRMLPRVLITVGAVVGGWLWLFGRTPSLRWRGLALPLVPLLASRVTETLKDVVGRWRPQLVDLDGLRAVVEIADARSFPSGHVTTATGFAVVLMWATPGRIGRAWLLLVPLMMWDRAAAGAHWASDVAAGAGIALVVAALYRRVMAGRDPRVGPWPRVPVLWLFLLLVTFVWRDTATAHDAATLAPLEEGPQLTSTGARAVLEPFVGPAAEARRLFGAGGTVDAAGFLAVSWPWLLAGLAVAVLVARRRRGPARAAWILLVPAAGLCWAWLAATPVLPGKRIVGDRGPALRFDALAAAADPVTGAPSVGTMSEALRRAGVDAWAFANVDAPPPTPQAVPAVRWTGGPDRARGPDVVVYGGTGAFRAALGETTPAGAVRAARSHGGVVLLASGRSRPLRRAAVEALLSAGAHGVVLTPGDVRAAGRGLPALADAVRARGGTVLAGSGAQAPAACGTGVTLVAPDPGEDGGHGPHERRRVLGRIADPEATRPVLFLRGSDLAGTSRALDVLLGGWRYLASLDPAQRASWMLWLLAAWLLLGPRRGVTSSPAGSRAPAPSSSRR